MIAESAESWARLRLVQGESDTRAWELVGTEGQIVLTVGSGTDSSWVVREEGVKPLHFSLHWDGSSLRVSDSHSAGDVRVDSRTIGAQWCPVVGRVRIDFGQAAIVVETSASAPVGASSPPSPSPLPPLSNAPSSSADAAKGSGDSVRPVKATLIGVPSLMAEVVAAKPHEPIDAAKKMTLLGVAAPPGPASEPASSGDGAAASRRSTKATLIGVPLPAGGFAPPEQAAATGAASGRPTAEVTAKPSSTNPPAATAGEPGVLRTTLRAGSSAPPPASFGATPASGERLADTWHEVPSQATQAADEGPHGWTADFVPGPGERFSDAPTEMRDPALQSRRPASSFPWRYATIAVLTCVAYFAWLYLLDHL